MFMAGYAETCVEIHFRRLSSRRISARGRPVNAPMATNGRRSRG